MTLSRGPVSEREGLCDTAGHPTTHTPLRYSKGKPFIYPPILYIYFDRLRSLASSTKMDGAELQSPLLDNGQPPLVAKRVTSEEPNAAADAKRLKTSDDREAPPQTNLPAATRIVPFPEKVCSVLEMS